MAGEGRDTLTCEVDGIPVCIRRDAMDDIDVMEMLGEMQDGNQFVMPKLMRSVLGAEQYANVKASLADEGGRTAASDMVTFFGKVMGELGETAKNS